MKALKELAKPIKIWKFMMRNMIMRKYITKKVAI